MPRPRFELRKPTTRRRRLRSFTARKPGVEEFENLQKLREQVNPRGIDVLPALVETDDSSIQNDDLHSAVESPSLRSCVVGSRLRLSIAFR